MGVKQPAPPADHYRELTILHLPSASRFQLSATGAADGESHGPYSELSKIRPTRPKYTIHQEKQTQFSTTQKEKETSIFRRNPKLLPVRSVSTPLG